MFQVLTSFLKPNVTGGSSDEPGYRVSVMILFNGKRLTQASVAGRLTSDMLMLMLEGKQGIKTNTNAESIRALTDHVVRH